MKIRRLLTSNAGTYIVTVTQFTDSKGGQCQEGQECRYQVAISDHPPEFHRDAGAAEA